MATRPPLAAVSTSMVFLSLVGGIVYVLGVDSHTCVRVSFHNAAWHGIAVAAAALHLAAVALVSP